MWQSFGLWLLKSKEGRKQRGQGVIWNDCPEIPFHYVHALSETSGNFFPAAIFFPPPLVDMLKDHTYVFNEVTDNHGKPAATAGGWVTLRRFNLLASQWESSLRKVKTSLKKKKKFFLKKERDQEPQGEIVWLEQLLLLLKTQKGGRRGPTPWMTERLVISSQGGQDECSRENITSCVEWDRRRFPTPSRPAKGESGMGNTFWSGLPGLK